MQVIIDQKVISYQKLGSGPALIMVHGWGDTKKTYTALATQLKSVFTCYVIDLPNFGDSEQNDRITSVPDYAVFLSQFIDKLAIKEYSVVGHSMGGQILIYATAEGLLRPEKCAYIGAAGIRSQHTARKKALKLGATISKSFLSKKIKNKIYTAIGSDYSHNLSALHKKIINNVLSYDVQDFAKKIQNPTLLIYGAQDKQTPVEFGKIFVSNMKNAELIIIDDADHWVHQTKAALVADKIKEFTK